MIRYKLIRLLTLAGTYTFVLASTEKIKPGDLHISRYGSKVTSARTAQSRLDKYHLKVIARQGYVNDHIPVLDVSDIDTDILYADYPRLWTDEDVMIAFSVGYSDGYLTRQIRDIVGTQTLGNTSSGVEYVESLDFNKSWYCDAELCNDNRIKIKSLY